MNDVFTVLYPVRGLYRGLNSLLDVGSCHNHGNWNTSHLLVRQNTFWIAKWSYSVFEGIRYTCRRSWRSLHDSQSSSFTIFFSSWPDLQGPRPKIYPLPFCILPLHKLKEYHSNQQLPYSFFAESLFRFLRHLCFWWCWRGPQIAKKILFFRFAMVLGCRCCKRDFQNSRWKEKPTDRTLYYRC